LTVSSNGTKAPSSGAALDWEVTGGGARHEGSIPLPELPEGELTQAGSAVWEPVAADKAYKLTLRVALRHDGQSINTNAWSFWAFPQLPGLSPTGDASRPEKAGNVVPHGVLLRTGPARDAAIPQDTRLVIADAADTTLADYIQAGGRCILNSRDAVIENRRDNFGIFRTIPWNRGTSGNSGTVISDHPAMALFPHEGVCDLPFVPLISGYRPMEFESLRPYGVTPIIRCIDHYVANRNNAYMLEFRLGKGSVLATSLGILDQLSKHVQARYLLHCLVDYARGRKLEPPAAVPRDEFLRLFQSRTDGEAACVPNPVIAFDNGLDHGSG